MFAVLLLVSFTGIALFGIFGMHIGMQGHSGNCIASILQGVDCPKESGTPEYLFFHLNAYKNFSLATFAENPLTPILLLALLFLAVVAGICSGVFALPQFIFSYSKHQPEHINSSPKQQLLRWLALHEYSPTFS